MEFKQVSYEIKDFDEKQGIVVAYANVYDVKDSDGDISAKGSFLKTVPENFHRIGVFKNHNPNLPVGIPLEIDPRDSYGLKTVTKFDQSITDGKEMYNHIKFKKENGRNTELSIGYEVVKRDEKNRSIITEYKLWEYSFLTAWAANSLSLVQDVKKMNSLDEAFIYLSKAYDFDFNDNTKRELETILKMVSNQTSDKDLEFIKMMIPHHEEAVKMSKKYIPLMSDANLISLAKNIIKTQSDELEILKSLENKEPVKGITLIDKPTDEQIKETLIKSFSQWK